MRNPDFVTPAAARRSGRIGRAPLDDMPADWISRHAGAAIRPIARGEVRAAFYTRYSTRNQNESSTVRQVEKCHLALARLGARLVKNGIYSDEERSGAYIANRTELKAMLERAKAGEIDVLVIESADRLSRDQVDMGWLWKELGRFNVDLVAEDRGKLGPTEIALYGFLTSEQRKTLMVRSQWAREDMVAEGRSPTGACYGYRVVRGKPGVLAKDPAQAKVVAWIFEMRGAGLTLSGIARSLNERHIPSPSGTTWKPTLVKCILSNPRYRGKLLYLRTASTTDSSTTERTVTKRPMEDWIASDCPKLRIVDVDLWDRVQAVGGATARPGNPGGKRRGPYMLSGHVHCPDCGTRSKIIYTDTVPRKPRMGCASAFGDGICKNKSTFLVEFLQAAVVGAIRSKLDRPDAIQAHLDALNAEHDALVKATAASREVLKKRVARLDARLMETLDPERTVGIPIEKLFARRTAITAELTPLEERLAGMPSERAALSLVPSHFEGLRAALDALAAQPAMRERDEASRRLIAAIRSLVGKVTVRREPGELGFRGTVEIRAGGFVAAGVPGSEMDAACERVDILFVNPPKAVSPERTALNLAARARDVASELGAATWTELAERLPPTLVYGAGQAPIDTRVAVATMIAALRLDRPFAALAPGAEAGGVGCKGLAVVDALVRGGLWDGAARALAECAPDLLSGLDPGRFDYLAAA